MAKTCNWFQLAAAPSDSTGRGSDCVSLTSLCVRAASSCHFCRYVTTTNQIINILKSQAQPGTLQLRHEDFIKSSSPPLAPYCSMCEMTKQLSVLIPTVGLHLKETLGSSVSMSNISKNTIH